MPCRKDPPQELDWPTPTDLGLTAGVRVLNALVVSPHDTGALPPDRIIHKGFQNRCWAGTYSTSFALELTAHARWDEPPL